MVTERAPPVSASEGLDFRGNRTLTRTATGPRSQRVRALKDLHEQEQTLSRSEEDDWVHPRQKDTTVSIVAAATGGPVALRELV